MERGVFGVSTLVANQTRESSGNAQSMFCRDISNSKIFESVEPMECVALRGGVCALFARRRRAQPQVQVAGVHPRKKAEEGEQEESPSFSSSPE